jgi:hypothetical protein
MNQPLMQALSQGMTEENRRRILHMIAEADPMTSPLMEHMENQRFMSVVQNLAVSYMNVATARISQDGTWEGIMAATTLTGGMGDLLKNPTLLNYTQTVMLITAAILRERS